MDKINGLKLDDQDVILGWKDIISLLPKKIAILFLVTLLSAYSYVDLSRDSSEENDKIENIVRNESKDISSKIAKIIKIKGFIIEELNDDLKDIKENDILREREISYNMAILKAEISLLTSKDISSSVKNRIIKGSEDDALKLSNLMDSPTELEEVMIHLQN